MNLKFVIALLLKPINYKIHVLICLCLNRNLCKRRDDNVAVRNLEEPKMARDLIKFFDDQKKSFTRYVSRVDSLLEKVSIKSDNQ